MSEKTANPAPLGLLGFGMTTILLNYAHNFRLGSVDGMILAMGLAYGGLAQVVAGVMEYKKGNTFGTVAFTSYGLFWWSYVFLNILPHFTQMSPRISGVTDEAAAAYFCIWGLFTLAMFFGTLKKNRAIQFVFMSLAILFFLLTTKFALLAYDPALSSETWVSWFTQAIGIEGIICGASAVYLAIAEVLNAEHGKTVLPICPVS